MTRKGALDRMIQEAVGAAFDGFYHGFTGKRLPSDRKKRRRAKRARQQARRQNQ